MGTTCLNIGKLMKYAKFDSADKSASLWKEMHSGIKL